MMKNPFPQPLRESWFQFDLTPDQRRYAAHAINQHERYVEFVRAMMQFVALREHGCSEADQRERMALYDWLRLESKALVKAEEEA